ncbi:uncharacterized protein LOC117653258 [Thrips palmi]|uniref:Uncharacterized protein LOC117653258 n=1 Tax=Thrips palmi TaxID=161013 RepID=A0A6P9ABE2_THRPL|nr:uncharacterized protein LOC117653258 [Thrips palmi]
MTPLDTFPTDDTFGHVDIASAGRQPDVHDMHSLPGDARDANGGLDAAPFSANGGTAEAAGLGQLGHPGTRQHVHFPDTSNARVVLDENFSQVDSPGTGVEDGSAGLEWPIPQDEKALLSYQPLRQKLHLFDASEGAPFAPMQLWHEWHQEKNSPKL